MSIEWAFGHLRPQYDLFNRCPPWTKAVDESLKENDLIAMLCGRRSGKSTYLGALLCMRGLPGEVHPFVSLTQAKARGILWPILERFQKTHGLRVDFNRQSGVATTDRGVKIACMGLSTKPEIEKLRGERYPIVVFDECGGLNQDLLKVAVDEAAGPATLDFAGRGGLGVICSGTPSYAPVGYWHDICGGNSGKGGQGFAVHRSNVFDNHHIPNARILLEKKKKQKGWTDETPEFVREWLGQFCLSSDGLCYGKAWNQRVEQRVYRPLVGTTIISVDFGESSPCAWNVIRVVQHTEQIDNMVHTYMHVHVLESFRRVCTSLQEIAAVTRQLMKTYNAAWLVGDSAEGFGIRQLQQYGLPFERSEKSGLKSERIMMMRGMLQCGTLRIYEDCNDLIEEISTVPWNEDRDDHHEAYADHCCDSLHYAIEKAMQVTTIRPAKPVPGSPEDLEAKRLEMRRKILGAARKSTTDRRR